MRPQITLGLLAVGAVVMLLAYDRSTPATPPPGGEGPTAAPQSPPPSASIAIASTPASTPVPTAPRGEDRIELPDGTSVPTLNGARGALSLAQRWGPRPWSPIVGIERSDAGVDWYVHADGTRSTTEMKWRPDLGRLDAMTRIALPQADPPTVGPGR